MEANRSIPDDVASNLGWSVGGIHSERRVRFKCPQANKPVISYAEVNNDGWPSHMIYQSRFQGEIRYFIFQCFCIDQMPPFGYRGNDFVQAAKNHLTTQHHHEVVKRYKELIQSRGIPVPSDFFVIEELGRWVRGCSAALANESNRQFCEDRFHYQKKANLEKYCAYEDAFTRSGVSSPATAPTADAVTLEHPEHPEQPDQPEQGTEPFDPVEAFMHGALAAPNSEATVRPVRNKGSRAVARHKTALASNVNGPIPNNFSRDPKIPAVTCNDCPPQARRRQKPSTGAVQEPPIPRNHSMNSSYHNDNRGVQSGGNYVEEWLMGLPDRLE